MPESKNRDTNWQLWCRLCAKDDPVSNVNIVFKDEQEDRGRESLSQYLYKYFSVQMDEALPKMLCTECFSFVTFLVNFTERVEKVQQMFQTLINDFDNKNVDFQAIRLQFGILENEREHIFIPQTSLLEVHYFESKPKIDVFEEKICEGDVDIVVNPLEQKILKFEERKSKPNIYAEETTVAIKEKNSNKIYSKENTEDDEDYDMRSNDTSTTTESEISDAEENLPSLSNKNVKVKNKNEVSRSGRQLRSCSDDVKCKQEMVRREGSTERNNKKKHFKQRECEYTCTECSRVFKRMQHFRQHMKRTHSISPSFSDWKCSYCPGRVFSTQYQLDKHLKIHLPPELKKTVPCPYCEKKFSTNGIMQTHIKYIHDNDRSFICEECGVTMRTNAALKAHMLTHTDYAPFECQVCKKGFKNKIRLKNHMETHDPHKHICAECGLQLNSRATLNRHLLVHSDVMLHKCDYCGRAFKRAKALKNHLILHTGLKPYSCDFCDRTFANGSNCRSHKKKAHPEELAALEASGGGKQYTRNIPKLEALKAVTKAADNLAPVVSKQSGCFAFGKKPKPLLTDPKAVEVQPHNQLSTQTSDTIKMATENLKTNSATENPQSTSASVPIIDNIYNHILKQSNGSQTTHETSIQTKNVLTENLSSMTLPDVALQLHRQQMILQSNQSLSQSQTPTSSVAAISPNTTSTFGSQLSKLSDLSLSTRETHLQQQRQMHQNPTNAFLYNNDVEMQQHQELLKSDRRPDSQASQVSDEHSHSPSVPFYSPIERDLQQGAFM